LSIEREAYSLKEFAQMTSLSRITLWREAKEGKLRTIKVRGRVLIPADVARQYLSGKKEEAQNQVQSLATTA
jgi:predicted site-specific integrase-resolvase